MNLTEHFTLNEMTFSPTAIKKGIKNEPSPEHIANFTLLCEKVLEPLREHMECPIRVSSGYRCEALNAIIGGSKSSQHRFGQAADISVHGRNHEIFDFIKNNLEFDQLIWEFGNDSEPAWIHVSFTSGKNRNRCLKAVKISGQTKYLVI
jgi:hypothetical protein